jgi:hypothetical protein
MPHSHVNATNTEQKELIPVRNFKDVYEIAVPNSSDHVHIYRFCDYLREIAVSSRN